METYLIKALQLILSLSILVLIHELGHFLFARLFKVRVEKFYIFFDAWFALFRFKPKNSETEYGIGWLPLGGYCKISGMIDESMDREQMAQPPQPHEFRSKPAGQRLLIMTAGVLFNFILALFIYSMILFAWGDTYLPLKNMKLGMDYSETFHQVGFQDGDILLRTEQVELERFGADALRAVVEAQQVTVLRQGVETTIHMPSDMMQRVMRDKSGFASVRYPMVVDRLADDHSPAAMAGLLAGDTILSIDGLPTPTVYDVREALADRKDREITLGFKRGSREQSLSFRTDTAGNMGIFLVNHPNRIYPTVTLTYSFFSAFPAGARLGVNTLKGYVGDMKYVFTKEGASSLGGFGAIGSLFPSVWDWRSFWMTTAFLSIILAFMNILPIPALDGGHVMFLLYEVITRRKPSDKFLEYAQITGMILLFALLLYANGNDIFRFITG
ncbi:MAG: RIP metalloprotease RseP [Tannerellaceae bacterium]|jgi:regulator of sigma E protease|nr:RIP metalloprotease RseP [Tannerellaceae bacterium]